MHVHFSLIISISAGHNGNAFIRMQLCKNYDIFLLPTCYMYCASS